MSVSWDRTAKGQTYEKEGRDCSSRVLVERRGRWLTPNILRGFCDLFVHFDLDQPDDDAVSFHRPIWHDPPRRNCFSGCLFCF